MSYQISEGALFFLFVKSIWSTSLIAKVFRSVIAWNCSFKIRNFTVQMDQKKSSWFCDLHILTVQVPLSIMSSKLLLRMFTFVLHLQYSFWLYLECFSVFTEELLYWMPPATWKYCICNLTAHVFEGEWEVWNIIYVCCWCWDCWWTMAEKKI